MATYAELQESLQSKERSIARSKKENVELERKLVSAGASVGGNMAAGGLAFLIGYLEQRVRTKDGAPLSVGPVSLPAVAGMALSTIGAGLQLGGFEVAGTVTSHAASGQFGLAGGTVGRGLGLKHYANKAQASIDRPKGKTAGELAGASDQRILEALISQAAED